MRLKILNYISAPLRFLKHSHCLKVFLNGVCFYNLKIVNSIAYYLNSFLYNFKKINLHFNQINLVFRETGWDRTTDPLLTNQAN